MYPSTQKTLERFLAESKVEEKDIPLSQLARLKDTNQIAIAFDGVRILEDIASNIRKLAPATVYTSTTPMCVYNDVATFIESVVNLTNYCEGNGSAFKPVVVFDGCGFMPLPSNGVNPSDLIEEPVANMDANGSIAQCGVAQLGDKVLQASANRFKMEEHLECLIMRRIREAVSDTFRGPYLAWSQISAFFAETNSYVSEVWGSLELLAFPGVQRVITSFDFEKGTFNCITRAAAMKAVRARNPRLTEEEFAAVLLMESKAKPFYFPLPHGFSSVFDEVARCSETASNSATERYLTSLRLRPHNVHAMRRNLTALDAPVLLASGEVVLLSELYNRPKRSHIGTYFGRQIPSIFFYFLFSGAVMATPYSFFSQCCIHDDWPVVDSFFFRQFSERVLPLRVRTCYQFLQIADSEAGKTGLRWLRRYAQHRKSGGDTTSSSVHPPPPVVLTHWNITPEQTRKNEDGCIYFMDVMHMYNTAIPGDGWYPDMETTLSAVLMRCLDSLGYFTHGTDTDPKTSNVCSYSEGLSCFDCSTLSEYGVLVIEMVRTGTLTDSPIALVPPGRGPDRFKAPVGARFAARLLSIIPLNLDSIWTGPFDPEIAAFGVVSRTFGNTLRMMTEVTATCLFIDQSTKLPLEAYPEVVSRLPFRVPVEFNGGFIIMHILMNSDCTLDSLRNDFPDFINDDVLMTDLTTLFWFWSMSFKALYTIFVHEVEAIAPSISVEMVVNAHMLIANACWRLLPAIYEAYFRPLEALPDFLLMEPQDRALAMQQQQQQHMQGPPAQMQQMPMQEMGMPPQMGMPPHDNQDYYRA